MKTLCSMQFILCECKSCMGTEALHKDSNTNLPYSSLVTLYVLGNVGKGVWQETSSSMSDTNCNQKVIWGEDSSYWIQPVPLEMKLSICSVIVDFYLRIAYIRGVDIGETPCVQQHTFESHHLQQDAQGGRRCETPLAYGDYRGREWVNPFWRSLGITMM